LLACSWRIFAEVLTSKKRELISFMSSVVISFLPYVVAKTFAGVINYTAYLKDASEPILPI